jgi:hypothetical protein
MTERARVALASALGGAAVALGATALALQRFLEASHRAIMAVHQTPGGTAALRQAPEALVRPLSSLLAAVWIAAAVALVLASATLRFLDRRDGLRWLGIVGLTLSAAALWAVFWFENLAAFRWSVARLFAGP